MQSITNSILWPAFAMAALVFVVWWRMFFERIGQLKRERIHPQKVATSREMAARIADTRAADNFRNLFELPVLFYAALFVAHATGQVGPLILALAWLFVLLRIVHSLIQCSYNRVKHRFYAYVAGGAALWALWTVLAIGMWTA